MILLKKYQKIITYCITAMAVVDALIGIVIAIIAWADTLGLLGLFVFFGSLTLSAILLALAVIINPKEQDNKL